MNPKKPLPPGLNVEGLTGKEKRKAISAYYRDIKKAKNLKKGTKSERRLDALIEKKKEIERKIKNEENMELDSDMGININNNMNIMTSDGNEFENKSLKRKSRYFEETEELDISDSIVKELEELRKPKRQKLEKEGKKLAEKSM